MGRVGIEPTTLGLKALAKVVAKLVSHRELVDEMAGSDSAATSAGRYHDEVALLGR
jgi:hypothetical protein